MNSRRKFFRHFIAEAIGVVDEIKGCHQMRLDNLPNLPDRMIRKMIPKMQSQALFRIKGACIQARANESEPFRDIYRLNEKTMSVIESFDGLHSVEKIGLKVARHYGLEEMEAYTFVKKIFILLTQNAFCVPLFDHDEIE